jgi:DNA-binding MarR family transcriptional regulator
MPQRLKKEHLPALEVMRELDLGVIQGIILILVQEDPTRGKTIGELRQALDLKGPALTSHVSRLLRMGLVTVVQDEVDMRTRRVLPMARN